jgi:hypothetical protein
MSMLSRNCRNAQEFSSEAKVSIKNGALIAPDRSIEEFFIVSTLREQRK